MDIKMNAKELFEELGFKQTLCINLQLNKHRQIEYETIHYDYIKIKVSFFDDVFYAQLYHKDEENWINDGGCAVYKQLLEAINKQCQELGWIKWSILNKN